MDSAREKAKTANTLVILLKSMVGLETTVELRNESVVRGAIEAVDSAMNVTMSAAVVTLPDGRCTECDDLHYIPGRNIRYVQIPDDVDVGAAIEAELGRLRTRGARTRVAKKPKLSEAEKRQEKRKKVDTAVELMKKNLDMI